MRLEANSIGCSVYDLDAKALSQTEIIGLQDLLYRKRLIVLKNQSLDELAYCDFARAFAKPVPYLQDNYHHPDHPLIFVSSNVKEGRQMGVARTGGYWHSDTSFEITPKVITMLMPKVLPQQHARSTRFIDMAEVYAALPPATRAFLDTAQLKHSGRFRYKVRPENAGLDIHEILELLDQYAPPVTHPAVITHPHTREKILYANRGFTIGVAHASLDRSAEVLKEVFDFAESARFVKEVQWSMGDVIIWDNRFLQHTSGRNSGPEEPTMMFRITGCDAYPLCASQQTEAAA